MYDNAYLLIQNSLSPEQKETRKNDISEIIQELDIDINSYEEGWDG